MAGFDLDTKYDPHLKKNGGFLHHVESTSHGGCGEECLLTVQFSSVVHFLKR
jgi:hypothetical protein